MPATLSNKPAVMKRKPMKEILKLAEPSTSTDHYSECSVHQLHTKMEGNTSHKENLDPVTAMQAPVISTNPVVIKKRAEMVLGGTLAVKKKTKRVFQTKVEKELLKQIIASKIKINFQSHCIIKYGIPSR
ncbi:unnamed protein product [Parnassius apollo]|uniref:(apollo) hypothetical protein n=1 Tax=Parnassius apollo TaxID=110799 RepID=A0A8S3WVV6_PARAO|nr:unnamed protein product [Parnassius apollo]